MMPLRKRLALYGAVFLFAVLLGSSTTAYLIRGDHALGYTVWTLGDSQPYGWVRVDVLNRSDWRDIAAHEVLHVRRRQKYSSSLAYTFAALHGGLSFDREEEAAAFCEQSRSMYSRGAAPTLDNAISQHVGWLAGYRSLHLTPAMADSLIRQACS